MYASLTSPPELAPLDWTRSRVRREHLINLGVPVNLDEVRPYLALSEVLTPFLTSNFFATQGHLLESALFTSPPHHHQHTRSTSLNPAHRPRHRLRPQAGKHHWRVVARSSKGGTEPGCQERVDDAEVGRACWGCRFGCEREEGEDVWVGEEARDGGREGEGLVGRCAWSVSSLCTPPSVHPLLPKADLLERLILR